MPTTPFTTEDSLAQMTFVLRDIHKELQAIRIALQSNPRQ